VPLASALRRTPDAGWPASGRRVLSELSSRDRLALGIAGIRGAFALCLIFLAVRLNKVARGKTYFDVSDAISPSS